MTTSPALRAAESDTRRRARRGLAVYFAVLVPLSAVFEALVIITGDFSWIWALMWTPAAASVVARVLLREGFADVSFRLGGRRGWKALGLALIFPIVLGLIAYGMAWATGLVQFSPRPIGLAAPYVGDAADQRRGAPAGPGERPDLGPLARAAHPGRRLPGGPATFARGSALHGHGHGL